MSPMKEGDIFLAHLQRAADRVLALRNWALASCAIPFVHEWLYWVEYTRANKN
mgnify:CR=1 FL=1